MVHVGNTFLFYSMNYTSFVIILTYTMNIICDIYVILQEQLQFRDGDNPVMAKIFELYMSFLQTSQSELVQKHAFGALRSFINKVC